MATNAHHRLACVLESSVLSPIDANRPKDRETHPGGPNTTTTRTHTQNVTHDHTQVDDDDLDTAANALFLSSSKVNDQTWKLDIKVLKRALVALRDKKR